MTTHSDSCLFDVEIIKLIEIIFYSDILSSTVYTLEIFYPVDLVPLILI